MVNEPKSERIQMLMEPSLRRAVRDWRFANQVSTEGEAIRKLIELGLQFSDTPEGLLERCRQATKEGIEAPEIAWKILRTHPLIEYWKPFGPWPTIPGGKPAGRTIKAHLKGQKGDIVFDDRVGDWVLTKEFKDPDPA